MAERTAAGQIWPHLPVGTPELSKQRERSLGDAMWPSLSSEKRAEAKRIEDWRKQQHAGLLRGLAEWKKEKGR